MNAGTPRPRSRWLQINVRSMLVLTAVIAALMAWLGPKFNFAREQRQAVEAITDSGGMVWYDYQTPGGKMTAPVPNWMRRQTGDYFFQHVEGVAFERRAIDDEGFAALRRFPYLKALSINLSASSNCDLSPLADLHSLERIRLKGKGCTDSTLSTIAGLKNLKALALEATSITDAGLDHLQGLTGLRELHIEGSVTDAGMLKLKPLADLKTLECSRFRVKGSFPRLRIALSESTGYDFSGTPAAEAIQYFANFHRVPVLVDKADPTVVELVDSGRITDSLANIELRTALEFTLRLVGLDWAGSPGGLLITTREKAAENRRGLDELRKSLPNLTTVRTDW